MYCVTWYRWNSLNKLTKNFWIIKFVGAQFYVMSSFSNSTVYIHTNKYRITYLCVKWYPCDDNLWVSDIICKHRPLIVHWIEFNSSLKHSSKRSRKRITSFIGCIENGLQNNLYLIRLVTVCHYRLAQQNYPLLLPMDD